MSVVAIITARGGSKRIPRKNIKSFMGRPMIAYAIDAALGSGIFEETMISTDDDEIAQIAKKHGADVPFMRSAMTSDDSATTSDVLNEVIVEYQKRGKIFEHFCCIYPCVPFLDSDLLKRAYQKFLSSGADSLLPVVQYSSPIQRALQIDQKGFVEYREPEHERTRSQDLPPMFHDVGMFYFCTTSVFLDNQKIVGDKTTYILIPESQNQDIDTIDDWKMAELKYQLIRTMEKSHV